MTQPSFRSNDALTRLRDECSWLLSAHRGGERLERALMGLYYSLKATRLASRIVESLLSGDASLVVSSGRGDDACYVAETMVRVVHSSGDLLAQVVNVCACSPRMRSREVSLKSVVTSLRKRVSQEPDSAHRRWLVCVACDLTALMDSPEYQYLQDFTNTAKHRDYIDRMLVTAADGCTIVFDGFKKDDRTHPGRSFADVLKAAEGVRERCEGIVRLLAEEKLAERTAASGGTLVGEFLSVSATPKVMSADEFSTRLVLYGRSVTDGGSKGD